MQPEEQRTTNCSCGRVCTYSSVQKLAQLQLSVNKRSLRAKGVCKKGKVVEKTRVRESSKSKVALLFFLIRWAPSWPISLYLIYVRYDRFKEKKKSGHKSRKFQVFSRKSEKRHILRFWDINVRISINRKKFGLSINYRYVLL